jgi:methanogenic corrinoid protein MtbC1
MFMAGPTGDAGAPIDELVDALVDGDRSRAETLFLEDRDRRGSFLATIDELVQPAMAQIGACWARGELSVAEEHLATATIQGVFANQLADLPVEPEDEGQILLACVEENEHALGPRVLADAFELAGWQVRYLGADVPTEALVAMVERWRPDLVALSVAMDMHVPVARKVVERIRELGDPQPTVLLGGRLEDPKEHLAEIGADAWAGSVREGMEAASA